MEPQVKIETDGDVDSPVHDNFVAGPSALGPDWWPDDHRAKWVDNLTDTELLNAAGIEPVVSTAEAAEYFDRTTQWIYWGLKPDPVTGEVRFVWPDGTPIAPDRIGDPEHGQRRFTTPILMAILQSCYRRGNVSTEDLKKIVRRIRYTEMGVEWRQREGWKQVDLGRNRRRWVKPEDAVYDRKSKSWKLRKRKDA